MKLEEIKEICLKCGAKCCNLEGPIVLKKEKDKILKGGFEDLFIPKGNHFEVKNNNGQCCFLKNNLCLIQEVKPLMCLMWPVFPIFKGNERKFVVLECPLTKHLSKTEIQKLKKLAGKLPREVAIAGIEELKNEIRKILEEFKWSEKVKQALTQ